jgi:hypothetical protein
LTQAKEDEVIAAPKGANHCPNDISLQIGHFFRAEGTERGIIDPAGAALV